MSIQALLDRLWRDYAAQNPQADRIHALLEARGERVVNDHIALRTFDDPRVGLDVLARPFLEAGYRQVGEYTFREKKLFARHYEPPSVELPLVFVSELQLERCSAELRAIVARLLDEPTPDTYARPDLPAAGRPWTPTLAEYERLTQESEYASWLAAFGFCANHFTVLVNALESFSSLQALDDFLLAQGFQLNTSGGVVKGTPADLLEQSSTLADPVSVRFADGSLDVPGCYYEFARRYPEASGKLFTGFIAPNADKIFESTDRR
jgi:hypothetical protein